MQTAPPSNSTHSSHSRTVAHSLGPRDLAWTGIFFGLFGLLIPKCKLHLLQFKPQLPKDPGTSYNQRYLLGLLWIYRNEVEETDFQMQTAPPTQPGVIRNNCWDFFEEVNNSKTPNATELKPKQLHQTTRRKQKSL